MIAKKLKSASHETMGILLENEMLMRKGEMLNEQGSLLRSSNPNPSLENLEQSVVNYQNAVDLLEEHKKLKPGLQSFNYEKRNETSV